ncbi:AAA family ATPase, partial [bacterium]|nr:AAA family ATPase [bacterium]
MTEKKNQNSPLAYRLRPKNLDEFFGQKKIINKNSFLYNTISNDRISSVIFWGPPGVGKTTLASIIAKQTNSIFKKLNAVTSGIKDLRKIVEVAEISKGENKKTILFIDEIHRWNKAQQDALLPHMENGTIVLIGATTQNPSFSINSPLLSRTKVIVLESLEEGD